MPSVKMVADSCILNSIMRNNHNGDYVKVIEYIRTTHYVKVTENTKALNIQEIYVIYRLHNLLLYK